MKIICFGQQNWDVCWTEKQQFCTRLTQRGHRVLYIDPDPVPLRLRPHRLARWWKRSVVPLSPRLWRLTFRQYLRMEEQQAVLGRAVRRVLGSSGIALVFRPIPTAWLDAAAPLGTVYYAVDEWTAFGGMSDEQRAALRAMEEAVLERSTVALAVSPRLVARFSETCGRTHLHENGVDVAHFSPEALAAVKTHAAVDSLPRPRIGFVGQIDGRLDQALLHSVARSRPQWQIVLAGRVHETANLRDLAALPNVHLIGFQPYEALPSVLRGFDVCIVPYVSSPLTESCNPAKVYEYLATGLPVVTTPLEGLNACRDVCRLARGSEAFVEAIDMALRAPQEGRAQRLAVAQSLDWERRTDLIEGYLRRAVSAGPSRCGSA